LRRFVATVRAADAVVAGNAFLAAEAARYTDPSRVSVVPTCVDPDRYPLTLAKPVHSTAELVWIGSSSTLQGLEAIAPVLEEIGRAVPNVRLKVICDRHPKLHNLPVVPCRWREATEAAELANSDIGISWIPDDLWSRGKCGLKILQYMAAGLPVVANPVGIHPQMIRHGETGFLAETEGEWLTAVVALAADPSLRQRMGAAGRRRMETTFSVRLGARTWLKVFERLNDHQASVG
jgi:glycosyltransferase involved in cell wall biosynthesis